MLVATDAIVLRSRKQGDTSKIVTLYSKEYGLVDVIAKGARQQKSKFGSALEPFTNSKIVFYRKEQTGGLYLLASAEVNSANRKLMDDLEHIEAATRIAELLIRSQGHEEGHPEIFELVCATLVQLDSTPNADGVWPILYSFFLRYCVFAGFEITIGTEIKQGKHYFFDIEAGTVLEVDTASHEHSDRYVALSGEMIGLLKHLNSSSSVNLRISPQARHGFDTLFRAYFATHLEGMQRNRTKSERVFGAMKK